MHQMVICICKYIDGCNGKRKKSRRCGQKNIPVTILIVLSSCMFKDQGLESQVSKLSTSFLVVNTT